MTLPKKVQERLIVGLKRYQPIVASAKDRDINEADTSTLVKDLLADVFGYDKYSEITAEHAIRGTFVDLALKVDGVVSLLVEVKAIGIELRDAHIKQAVDYGANKGVDWVVLTNGEHWKVFKIAFTKPIGQELVFELRLSALSHKNEEHLEDMYALTREGWSKSELTSRHEQRQALNHFLIGAVLMSEPVLDIVRRTLRRVSPDARIELEQIAYCLEHEVLKREVVEGEKAVENRKKVARSLNRALRARAEKLPDASEERAIDSEEDFALELKSSALESA